MEQPIRAQLRPIIAVAAVAFGVAAVGGSAFISVAVVVHNGPTPLAIGLSLLMAVSTAVLAREFLITYHWVQVLGGRIQGRLLFTRRLIDQPISQITEIRPIRARGKRLEVFVADKLLGQTRGYEVRFSEGASIVLMRHDMKGVEIVLDALKRRGVHCDA